MEEYDILIIGAGPAGLTAGIYAGRQGSETLILDKISAGGLGSEVPMMENYPGFEMIAGMQLVGKMKKQALKYVEINEMEEVKKIEFKGNEMRISTQQDDYIAKSVIICTGTKHRKLKVPGENDFLGSGVCYCATCDGPFFKNKKVLMIGGGNAAAQEALFLKNIDCDVSIVHRRDELRAEQYLQDKLHEKNIPIIWNSVVKEIKGDTKVETVVLFNRKTGKKVEIPSDGIFISIGEEPTNKLAASIGVKLDPAGYLITDKFQRTNIPKVYAAGDITGGIKQWVVACAEGAIAAISAYNDLMRE
ncbi:MAG: thioredoxin-disulfide reductase [Euryarchaeota archaeon]|nr:thioredoxin-disulfide reductase [Euryarchaeota archaeon]